MIFRSFIWVLPMKTQISLQFKLQIWKMEHSGYLGKIVPFPEVWLQNQKMATYLWLRRWPACLLFYLFMHSHVHLVLHLLIYLSIHSFTCEAIQTLWVLERGAGKYSELFTRFLTWLLVVRQDKSQTHKSLRLSVWCTCMCVCTCVCVCVYSYPVGKGRWIADGQTV